MSVGEAPSHLRLVQGRAEPVGSFEGCGNPRPALPTPSACVLRPHQRGHTPPPLPAQRPHSHLTLSSSAVSLKRPRGDTFLAAGVLRGAGGRGEQVELPTSLERPLSSHRLRGREIEGEVIKGHTVSRK